MRRSQHSSPLWTAARCIGALALVATFTLASPQKTLAGPPMQAGTAYTATGGMETRTHVVTNEFTFEFDPRGSAFSVPFKGNDTWTNDVGGYDTCDWMGMVTGNYEGGDGGPISGTFSGQSTHTIINPGVHDVVTNDFSGTWAGKLGVGTGEPYDRAALYFSKGFFSVASSDVCARYFAPNFAMYFTFKGDAFADYQGLVVIPTGVSVPVSTVELTQEARDFIAHSSTLSEAAKAVLNQDSVIFARDDNNHFYAINNQGKSTPIPAPVSEKFNMSNEFTLLHNKQTLQGLLDKIGDGSDESNINGGSNAAAVAKIPGDLKDHDYGTLSTECSSAGCVTQFKMNSTATSTHISDTAVIGIDLRYYTGSENSSVRGTINGGGDFIFAPGNWNQMAFFSLALPLSSALPDANNPAYLGVQAQDESDGAVISMIQRTSPAEQAGLAIGDKVVSVSGAPVDAEHTLASIISQNAGGNQVDLGIVRNGSLQTIPVTLAQLLPSMIITPSAEITVGDNTELAVDIGFNGVTGVLVLAQSAIVREPVTGSQVNVPAGAAVIVVPGYSIANPIPVAEDQVTQWWKGDTTPNPVSPTIAPANNYWLLGFGALGLCAGGIILIGMLAFFSRRRPSNVATQLSRARPSPPESLHGRRPAPPEKLSTKNDAGKPPPPEKL